MDKIITYTITASEDGWPLYKVLRERLALSGSRIRHLKYIPGGITVNGASYLRSRPVTTRFILKAGDELRLLLTDEGPSVVPNPGPLTLLYQSDDLLFVDRRPGGTPGPRPLYGYPGQSPVRPLSGADTPHRPAGQGYLRGSGCGQKRHRSHPYGESAEG